MSTSIVDFISRGTVVTRFHTHDCIKPQNIADHSFGVAWFCYVLSNATIGGPSAALLINALAHDLAEHVTGDIPAPAKRMFGLREKCAAWEDEAMRNAGLTLPEMTIAEAIILKQADCLEGMAYCLRERKLGNLSLNGAMRNFHLYLRSEPTSVGLCLELANYLKEQYDAIGK